MIDTADMNELRIGLVAIGLVLVLGVALFNWMQQRRYRRESRKAFAREHEDVLLRPEGDDAAAMGGRVEPQLRSDAYPLPPLPPTSVSAEPEASGALADAGESGDLGTAAVAAGIDAAAPDDPIASIPPANAASSPMPAPTPAPTPTPTPVPASGEGGVAEIDYVVNLHAAVPATEAELAEVLQRKFDFGKPVRWLGQRKAGAPWEEMTAEALGRSGFLIMKGCLQLADRAGPVSEVSLSGFHDMAQHLAARTQAALDAQDVRTAHARALSLDQFCAEVDVMVGLNIISRDSGVFTGAKIQVLAEASGFRLGANGTFGHRGEDGTLRFFLGNQEASPFLADGMRILTTRGITFLLDVPRVADGERAFDDMTHLARSFADTLGGIMVDDNGVTLSDAGIGKIRQQLGVIQSSMRARGIPAGGEVALRLFA